jgi:hypothetical protein
MFREMSQMIRLFSFHVPQEIMDKFEQAFIDEMRQPAPDMPALEHWNDIRKGIRIRGAKGDLSNWYEWPELAMGGMWSGPIGYNSVRLPPLMANHEWASRWLPCLADGTPSSIILPGASSTAIGHAHQMLVLERMTGHRISDYDFIFEFGGGYGSFARIAHALGFRGQYYIHDLPELAALQRLYLGQRGIPVFHSGPNKQPEGSLSLAISMHAADETGPVKLNIFGTILPLYSSVYITSGCDPIYWRTAMGGHGVIEPIPVPPGNSYICR